MIDIWQNNKILAQGTHVPYLEYLVLTLALQLSSFLVMSTRGWSRWCPRVLGSLPSTWETLRVPDSTLAWPSPGCYRHLRSKPEDERYLPVSLSLFLSFSLSRYYSCLLNKSRNLWKAHKFFTPILKLPRVLHTSQTAQGRKWNPFLFPANSVKH